MYYITTLAVHQPYFLNSIEFFKDLSKNTEHALFNITTTAADIIYFETNNDCKLEDILKEYPRITITTLDDFNKVFKFPLENKSSYFPFHVNLKSLALKACVISGKKFDYVIYVDADWKMYNKFSESKIITAFSYMEEQGVDAAFERPSKVGPYKTDSECFFPDKIKDYNILEHDVWDDAHVFNEQFMIFKNNWKLKLFVLKWEQFLWYSIANGITNYAEGFEIGVSALESKMISSYYGIFNAITECFYFYNRFNSTDKNIRF